MPAICLQGGFVGDEVVGQRLDGLADLDEPGPHGVEDQPGCDRRASVARGSPRWRP